jgi:hypothetical protein
LRILDIVSDASAARAAILLKAKRLLLGTVDRGQSQNTTFIISAELEHSPLSFGWKKCALDKGINEIYSSNNTFYFSILFELSLSMLGQVLAPQT